MPLPLLYESHSHTPLCKHANGMPSDYAAVAEVRGLRGITLTCHCPLPDGFSANVRMSPDEYEDYVTMVVEARDEYIGRVDVRLGLESDFYPGVEPWLVELHARHPLSHVLGSVHPQVLDYKAIYFNDDYFDYQQVYFDHLAMAAESGLFDTLAHPDLIKNESPADWELDRILPHIEKSLDRIAATGVAMELNTSGRHKRIPEFNPNSTMLGLMRERGIPVVLGADAHQPERVAEGYEDAMQELQNAGYSEINFFLDRKRQTIAINDALASLKPLEESVIPNRGR